MMLFADEAGFSLHPKLGRIWFPRGKKSPVVMTKSQHQKRVNVLGWVDPIRGRHGMMKIERGNRVCFLRFLRVMARRFRDKIVDIWVDGPKWHRGEKILAFLRVHRHITLHYLPAYHPELNCQEILWKTMRYEETTNIYFESVSLLKNAISRRSRRWKPAKILSLCQLI
jgi:transposase